MLLAIDIGNTNIVFGVFGGSGLAAQWRCVTDPSLTADDYGRRARAFLEGTACTPDQIDGAVIASVVPQVLVIMQQVCAQYFKQEPLIVAPELDLGLELCYETPLTLGADRIVNAGLDWSLSGPPVLSGETPLKACSRGFSRAMSAWLTV